MTKKTFSHNGNQIIETKDAAPELCLGIRNGVVAQLNEVEARELRERTHRRATQDALLSAVETPKSIEAAREGVLSVLKRARTEIKELITPFCSGQVLTPEVAKKTAQLGLVWNGVAKLHDNVEQGHMDEEMSKPSVGETHVTAGGTRVLGAGAPPTRAAELQQQIDKQYGRPEAAARDAAPSGAQSIAEIEAANRAFWAANK